MAPEINAAHPLALADLPLVNIPRGRVVPKDVVRAVASKVTDSGDLIAGGVGAGARAVEPLTVRPYFPDVGLNLAIARNAGPKDIGVVEAATKEVADSGDLIVAGMCSQIDAVSPCSVGNLPFVRSPVVGSSQKIALFPSLANSPMPAT